MGTYPQVIHTAPAHIFTPLSTGQRLAHFLPSYRPYNFPRDRLRMALNRRRRPAGSPGGRRSPKWGKPHRNRLSWYLRSAQTVPRRLRSAPDVSRETLHAGWPRYFRPGAGGQTQCGEGLTDAKRRPNIPTVIHSEIHRLRSPLLIASATEDCGPRAFSCRPMGSFDIGQERPILSRQPACHCAPWSHTAHSLTWSLPP